MYEPLFRFLEWGVFFSEMELKAFEDLKPIFVVRNKRYDLFGDKQKLEEFDKKQLDFALVDGAYETVKEEFLESKKQFDILRNINIKKLDNQKMASFFKEFIGVWTRWIKHYMKIDRLRLIEKELNKYIKGKCSFQDVLSEKVDVSNWPEDKKRFVRYIINIQHLKMESRKFINEILIAKDCFNNLVFEEIMDRIKRKDVLLMTSKEIEDCLAGKEMGDTKGRDIYSYLYLEGEEIKILSGGEAYKKIRELEKNIPKNDVIGTPACRGTVTGKAKVVPFCKDIEKHFSKIEKGDILIADTTGPEMTEIIKKAAAIVVNQGGQTTHAAVISREFNIPCVVGTNYATEIFKDGDILEVNANNGIVKKIG
jgi:pyruvate,water dikinase